MMYSYPYGMYRPYYSYYNRQKFKPPVLTEEAVSEKVEVKEVKKQPEKQEDKRCDEKPVFEFLGLRLFLDDLLILAILFFLYSEGVQDPELFIALVLLLIS